MVIKRKDGLGKPGRLHTVAAGVTLQTPGVGRRAFLRRSGLAVSGLAAVASLRLGAVRKAKAIPGPTPGAPAEIRKNVCTHCSVGCTVLAEVQNGVWTGQEPGWDSPINRGTHCAQGAAIRATVNGEIGRASCRERECEYV